MSADPITIRLSGTEAEGWRYIYAVRGCAEALDSFDSAVFPDEGNRAEREASMRIREAIRLLSCVGEQIANREERT